MDKVQHKCPKCQKVMKKLDTAFIEANKGTKQNDYFGNHMYGTSGYGTSTSYNASTSGNAAISGITGPNDLSSIIEKSVPVIGVPYECPKCFYKRSFRS